MNCDQTMDLITGYIFDWPSEEKQLEKVYRHIAHCATCRKELKATIRLINDTELGVFKDAANFRNCSVVRETLADCLELNDDEMQRRFPDIVAHMQTCQSCQKDFRLLKKMVLEEKKGGFGVLPSGPSYGEVGRVGTVTPGGLWQEVDNRVRRLAMDLKLLACRGGALFADLPQWLNSSYLTTMPVPARAFRGKEARSKAAVAAPFREIHLPDEDQDMQVIIATKGTSENKIDLIIKIRDLKIDSLIIGCGVTLYDENNLLLEHSITVEKLNGIVEFNNLGFGKYLLKIVHNLVSWEISLTVSTALADVDADLAPNK